MIHYFLIERPYKKTVEFFAVIGIDNTDNRVIENATVRESPATKRLYIVDRNDSTKEYASFPLDSTSIITEHGKE